MVENEGKVILVDPGNYSYESKALDINSLKQLDLIAITHQHADHMYIPWIKEIVEKFPQVKIITNASCVNLLAKEGIQATTNGNEFISLQPVPHEKIWMGSPAENTMITLFNRFATVGDSLTFEKSPEILALPVTAPWGSTEWAVETALHVQPKVIIPIHDYHWKDEWRKNMYQRLHEFFATKGIDFKAIETGEIIEV